MRKTIIYGIIFFVIACGVIFIAVQQRSTSRQATLQNLQKTQNTTQTDNVVGRIEEGVTPTPYFKNRPTLADLKLTLSNPSTTIVSASTGSVVVTGATSPFTSLIINEFELTSDASGNFSKSIALDEGDNYISIIAYSLDGASAEKEIIVTRESTE